jgi:hypothetical protein
MRGALTNRELLIERACNAQELAADAHYWAVGALKAAQWKVACEWQAIGARASDRAAGDVTRLLKAPEAWLELEA